MGPASSLKRAVLAPLGEQRKDSANVVNEAHVEHAVRFVEDKVLDMVKMETLVVKVEKTPRRRDEQVDPAACSDLQPLIDPTKHDEMTHVEVSGVVLNVVADLRSELARRRQHETTNGSVARGGRRGHVLQDGQQERGRLPGPGLRDPQHVPSIEKRRDGLCLNGRGGLVVLLCDGAQQWLDQVEIVEGRHWDPPMSECQQR